MLRKITIAIVLTLLLAGSAMAKGLEVDIFGPGQSALNLVFATPLATNDDHIVPAPPEGAELDTMLKQNFSFLPFLKTVDGSTIIGGNTLEGYKSPAVDFKRYQLAGVDLLITTGWPKPAEGKLPSVEIRAYESFTGKLVLGKAYFDVTKDSLTRVADRFSEEFMRTLTGRGEFFRSTLAFVRQDGKTQKDIWAVRPTGRDLRQLTNIPGLALSPSWSPDGRYVIFSHIGSRFHSLGIWDRLTRRVQQIKFPGNTIIGPTFLPNNKVAVSLAAGGNPDIYLLNHLFKKEKLLVRNWAIDVSPSFDADGGKMVFVSSRRGNPHIFLHNMKDNSEIRLTRNGKYNTHPSISADGELVAFARRTSKGHRIFVLDLVTGRERQVSFGPGNDEQPSFGPDGYFLAFSSNRTGKYKVYLTTRHGGDAKLVNTGPGAATLPSWGMIPEGRKAQ